MKNYFFDRHFKLLMAFSLFLIHSNANAQNQENYYQNGIKHALNQNFSKAISSFSKAIEIDPRFENAYVHRGISKYNLNDLDGAYSDYNKALEIKPFYDFALTYRGILKYKREDFNQAILDYDKAIEINPKYVLAYTKRGEAKNRLKNNIGACWDWEIASTYNNNDPEYNSLVLQKLIPNLNRIHIYSAKQSILMINEHCK